MEIYWKKNFGSFFQKLKASANPFKPFLKFTEDELGNVDKLVFELSTIDPLVLQEMLVNLLIIREIPDQLKG